MRALLSAHASERIFVASTIAATTTYLSISFLGTVEWLRLIIGGIVFLTVYIVAAPSIGAIDQDDISNLKVMLSGLGFISTIANLPLSVAEKVARIGSPRKEEIY